MVRILISHFSDALQARGLNRYLCASYTAADEL